MTAAEVNLKFVWDVVSRIRIGEAGLAYVIDADGEPDRPSRHQPRAAQDRPQPAAAGGRAATAPTPRRGRWRAASAATRSCRRTPPIPTLHWTVFVESPEAEAFAPLYASILRAALLLGAGLLVSMVASFFVARALVRPLQALQEGAARIGAGELDRRIEVKTGDELERRCRAVQHRWARR